jgi:hypothetical protein
VTDDPREETTEQTPATEPAPEPAADHHRKHEVRDAVAKAVGLAVEAGSLLAGNAGDLVSAEAKVAEADTEQFLDRIDGEG